ncbi:MAG: RnfABCDGE type electron transport complex subunit D [Gammaproteobacteria bacterium]|jgi:electron transport complex protein RnfD
MDKKTLQIHSSPHISSGASVDVIMRNVVYALMPTVVFSIYAFGLAALLTLLVGILSCIFTEHLLCKWSRQATTVNDWSVVITGIIYGLTLPPGLPLWMTLAGGVIAVSLGKFIFGGLGYNPFNPALVGRAFLQAAFPTAMTSWTAAFSAERFTSLPTSTLALPLTSPIYDSLSSATPLADMKFNQHPTDTVDLLLGLTSGSLGETCSALILAGGLYLIARNMMNWRIPAGIFIAVIVLSALFHFVDPDRYPSTVFMLFSGGLMLGAMFMATDMVASPITNLGCFIYGAFIGTLVVIIRLWGGMPEGVMYAILFANAISPHIDRYIQPTPFGHRS